MGLGQQGSGREQERGGLGTEDAAGGGHDCLSELLGERVARAEYHRWQVPPGGGIDL